MSAFQLAQEFVLVECGPADKGGCDITFAMTEKFYDETKRTGRTWYCPNGHPWVWTGPTTETQLRDAKAKTVALEDQLRAAIRDAERTRAALVRDRHRVANGLCPCCNRYFENVHRHIRGQHPDYDASALSKRVKLECSCGYLAESFRGLRAHQGRTRATGWDKPGQGAYWAHLTVVGT